MLNLWVSDSHVEFVSQDNNKMAAMFVYRMLLTFAIYFEVQCCKSRRPMPILMVDLASAYM